MSRYIEIDEHVTRIANFYPQLTIRVVLVTMLFEWSSIHTVLKMTNGRELCLFPCRGVCLIYPVSRWNRGCRCWMQCHVTVLCFYVHHPWSLSTGGRGGSDFHQKKRKKKRISCTRETAWLTSRLHQQARSLSFSCGFVDKNICAQVFFKKNGREMLSLCVWCPVSAQAQCCTSFLCVFFVQLIWYGQYTSHTQE